MKQLLLPGYVIVDTSQPELLMQTLRKIPDFTRLLTMGETFAPLEERDVEWIGAFTQKGRRTIPMSMGVMEGDRVVVTEGPSSGEKRSSSASTATKALPSWSSRYVAERSR